MIIQRLALRNFGCLGDAEFEFTSGLNIIRGPNEAGKSTLEEALLVLLFEKVTSRRKEVRDWQRWGAPDMYTLSADFSAADTNWRLVKDFANKRTSLVDLDSAVEWTDHDQVQEKLAELIGTGSRDIYESTAAIRQQELTRLAAGQEIGEVLQGTISGSVGRVSVPNVLDRLQGALADMRRGLDRPAPKNPGVLWVVGQEIDGLEETLRELETRGGRIADAWRRQREAEEQLGELAPRIEQTQELLEKIDKRRELEGELEGVESAWTALHERVEEAGRLAAEIEKLTGALDGLPEVTAQEAERVEQLSAVVERAAGDIQVHEERLAQLRAQLGEVGGRAATQTGGISAGEIVQNALRLQQAVTEAQEDARRLELDRSSIDQRIQASTRQGYTRLVKIIAGLLLAVGGGLAAALLSPWWLFLTAVGVVLVLSGVAARAPQSAAELLVEREQIEAQLGAAYQELAAAQQELGALLDSTGAETVADLNSMLAAAVRKIDELKASIAATEEALGRARQEEGEANEELAQLLAKRFDSPGELLAAHEQRTELHNRIAQKSERLAGVLGSEQLEQMREQLGRLAMDRATIQQQLESPELAHIDVDVLDIEWVRNQITSDQQRQREIEGEGNEVGFILEHTDYDAEQELRTREELDAARQREARLREKEAVYELTAEVLEQAYEQTLDGVTKVMEPRVAELLGAITQGRYEMVRMSSDSLVPVVFPPERGEEVDSNRLSCATREQLYLAARLVLTEMLWPGEGPPLLLDDPLVNFDAQRDAATLALLAQFAQTRQLLVFTCSPRFDQYGEQVIELPGPG